MLGKGGSKGRPGVLLVRSCVVFFSLFFQEIVFPGVWAGNQSFFWAAFLDYVSMNPFLGWGGGGKQRKGWLAGRLNLFLLVSFFSIKRGWGGRQEGFFSGSLWLLFTTLWGWCIPSFGSERRWWQRVVEKGREGLRKREGWRVGINWTFCGCKRGDRLLSETLHSLEGQGLHSSWKSGCESEEETGLIFYSSRTIDIFVLPPHPWWEKGFTFFLSFMKT